MGIADLIHSALLHVALVYSEPLYDAKPTEALLLTTGAHSSSDQFRLTMAKDDSQGWALKGTILSTAIGSLVDWLLNDAGVMIWIWETGFALLTFSFTLTIWQALLVLAGLFILILGTNYVTSEIKPDLPDYTSDEIEGVRWEWKWNKAKNSIHHTPYCPECDLKLKIEGTTSSSEVDCENCDFKKRWNMRSQNLLDLIERRIDRRLRKGETSNFDRRE